MCPCRKSPVSTITWKHEPHICGPTLSLIGHTCLVTSRYLAAPSGGATQLPQQERWAHGTVWSRPRTERGQPRKGVPEEVFNDYPWPTIRLPRWGAGKAHYGAGEAKPVEPPLRCAGCWTRGSSFVRSRGNWYDCMCFMERRRVQRLPLPSPTLATSSVPFSPVSAWRQWCSTH